MHARTRFEGRRRRRGLVCEPWRCLRGGVRCGLPRSAARLAEGNALCCELGGLRDQVVLLRADHAAGAADADVADRLLRAEAVVLHHVRADEHARAAQARLAVHCQRACMHACMPPQPMLAPCTQHADLVWVLALPELASACGVIGTVHACMPPSAYVGILEGSMLT
jgi:hypothetical protein